MDVARCTFDVPAVLLSGVLITHQLSDEAVEWFATVRSVCDELVAFVDEDRAAPDVDRKLQHLGARILNTRSAAFYNADFGAMVAACRGEWLLKVDYDEELSREWQDTRWRDELLRQDEFNHFWCPRRWLTGRDTYIATEPWWPDWQLRLFRNQPDAITFPNQLHETMRMTGEPGYLRTLAIHHHDLRLASRAAREAKAAAYEAQRPGGGLGFFYLYEDHDLPALPLPAASEFEPGQEILRMHALSEQEIDRLALDVDGVPAEVSAGGLFWPTATFSNGTTQTICAGAPNPINLAYHWLNPAGHEPLVFDGERTAVLPELAPGKAGTFRMFIKAPPQPGEYLLRIALVQERVRWMDQANSSTARDFLVSVGST